MSNPNIAQKIYNRFINDPAGFALAFTDIFKEKSTGQVQNLYPLQIEFLNAPRESKGTITVVVKCRQCLTGDSMIYTVEGPKSIKNLLDSNYRGKVYTIDEDGKNVIDDVVDIWGAGKKDILEVKLASGERIKASKDHKIKTINGWRKISELTIGDLVINFEGNFSNNSLPEEELIIMGYYIINGSYSNSTPKFTNINEKYLKEFCQNIIKFDPSLMTVWKPKGNGYDISVVGDSWDTNKTSSFEKYLTNLDLRGVDASKRILPAKFLNLDKKSTSLLLNRIFAGDGWYSSCGKNKTNEVGIGSPSLEFLYQIAYLLSKYGIHASIYPVNSGKKQKITFYKLKFSSNEYVEKFIEEIGIYDKTPRSGINYSYKVHKQKNRVVSIKEIGEDDTYDLTTKTHSSFIANGILVHNSGYSTAIKARSLHNAYFGLVPNILIASASERQSTKILYEMREHIESMPEFMRPELSKDNASEIHFKSGSKIISLPANPQTVRGFSGTVFWDEASLFSRKESEKFFSAIFPTISKGFELVLVSTPEGRDNIFYDLCNPKLPKEGEDEIKGIRANKIIKVLWSSVPHIKKFIDEGGFEDYSSKTFLQEYCCEFLSDDENSLFTSELIDRKFISKDLDIINIKHLDFIEGSEIEESDKINIKEQFDKIYIGYDPSISSAKDADGAGVSAVGVKEDLWTILLSKNLPKGLSQAKQCDYISRLALCLNADKIGFDGTGGMGISFKERLEETPIRNKLISVVFANNLKQQEYVEIKHKIEAGKMISPDIAELRKQMLNLGYNQQTGRIAAMGSWRTAKDDLPSSLLCAHYCRQKSNNSGFFII